LLHNRQSRPDGNLRIRRHRHDAKGAIYTHLLEDQPIEVSFVANRTPLLNPLLDGEIAVKGFELRPRPSQSIDDTSRRMLELEFDFGEVSMGTFIRGLDRGVPFVALPIFTNSRQFLNANLHVATHAGIQDLSQLRGRTIGAPQYWTASSLWQRHFLRDSYGVEAEEMSWITLQPERIEGLDVPAGVRHRLVTDRTAEELAEAGELDAVTTPLGRRPDGAGTPSPLVPFFPDRAAAQRAYYERTGIYPLQYVVITRRELADTQPEIVAGVCDALLQAKAMAGARGPLGSPELVELVGDPWPFGLSANRTTLEAFVSEAYRQGATSRQFAVEELFAKQLPPSMS
jgi:4,5-dihydroxyphthalate decarboxylase